MFYSMPQGLIFGALDVSHATSKAPQAVSTVVIVLIVLLIVGGFVLGCFIGRMNNDPFKRPVRPDFNFKKPMYSTETRVIEILSSEVEGARDVYVAVEEEKVCAEPVRPESKKQETPPVREIPTSGRTAAEKPAVDNLASDKFSAEKFAAKKVADEKLAADKLAADEPAAEKIEVEKVGTEKVAAENPPTQSEPETKPFERAKTNSRRLASDRNSRRASKSRPTKTGEVTLREPRHPVERTVNRPSTSPTSGSDESTMVTPSTVLLEDKLTAVLSEMSKRRQRPEKKK